MDALKTLLTDSYLSIASLSEGAYKDNGSRFFPLFIHVHPRNRRIYFYPPSEKKYYDATHHCYAYRIGREGNMFRINDDGEPVLYGRKANIRTDLSNNLSDVLLVVVEILWRCQAWSARTYKGLQDSRRRCHAPCKNHHKISTERFKITFDYPSADKVMKELKNWE